MGDISHLSKKTRERAYILARNARTIGLSIGDARFKPTQDYMSWWLTDGEGLYVVLFATPQGYLAEVHREHDDGSTTVQFFCIRNIRAFIFKLKKMRLEDASTMLTQEISPLEGSTEEDGEDEVGLKDFIEDLDD